MESPWSKHLAVVNSASFKHDAHASGRQSGDADDSVGDIPTGASANCIPQRIAQGVRVWYDKPPFFLRQTNDEGPDIVNVA